MESPAAPDSTKKDTVSIVPKSPRVRIGKRSPFLPSVNVLVDKFEEIRTPDVSLSPTKVDSEVARQDVSAMDTSDGKPQTPHQNGSVQMEATPEEASHGPITREAKIAHKTSSRRRPKSHLGVEGPGSLETETMRSGRPLSLGGQTPSSPIHLPREDDHHRTPKDSLRSQESKKEGGRTSGKLPSVRHLVKKFEKHAPPKDIGYHHRSRTHGSPMHPKLHIVEANGEERVHIHSQRNESAGEPKHLLSPIRSPERLLLSEDVCIREIPSCQEKRRRLSHKEPLVYIEKRDENANQHAEVDQKTPVKTSLKSSGSMPDLESACNINENLNLPQPEPITIIVSHSRPQATTVVETRKGTIKVQEPAERARKTSDTLLPPQPKEEFANEILGHISNNSEKPTQISTPEAKPLFVLKHRPSPTLSSDELEYSGLSSPNNESKVSNSSSSLASTPRRRTGDIMSSSPLFPELQSPKTPTRLISTPRTPESALPRLGAESMRVRPLNTDELKLFGLETSLELEKTPKGESKTGKVLKKQEFGVRLLHGDELRYFGKEHHDSPSNNSKIDSNESSNSSGVMHTNGLDEETRNSAESQVTSPNKNTSDHQEIVEKCELSILDDNKQQLDQSVEVSSEELMQDLTENEVGTDVGKGVEVQEKEVQRKNSVILETLVEVSPATEKMESEINESFLKQFAESREEDVIGDEEASLIMQLQDDTPVLKSSTLSDLENKRQQEQLHVGAKEIDEEKQSPRQIRGSLADKLLEEITQTLYSLDSSPLQCERIKLAVEGGRQEVEMQESVGEVKSTETTCRTANIFSSSIPMTHDGHVENPEETSFVDPPKASDVLLNDTETDINSTESIPNSITPPVATTRDDAHDQKPLTEEPETSRTETRHEVSLVSSETSQERGVSKGPSGEIQQDQKLLKEPETSRTETTHKAYLVSSEMSQERGVSKGPLGESQQKLLRDEPETCRTETRHEVPLVSSETSLEREASEGPSKETQHGQKLLIDEPETCGAETKHEDPLVSSEALTGRGLSEGATGEWQQSLSSLSTVVFTSGAAAVVADIYLYLVITIAHHILLWLFNCVT